MPNTALRQFAGKPAAVFILTAALLFASCSRNRNAAASTDQGAAAGENGPVTVAVAKVELRDLVRPLVLAGQLEASREEDVLAKAAGSIREIRVHPGDRVNQGVLLATMEVPTMSETGSPADMQLAQDQLESAQESERIAQAYYQSLLDLSRQQAGVVPQQEIDQANGKVQAVAAQVSVAAATVAAARAHTAAPDSTRLSAPFAGVITRLYAETGSRIQAGMPVLRIAAKGPLRLMVRVPESAASAIHSGRQFEVRVPALRRSFPASVIELTSGLVMQLDVPDPSQVLIPGMRAEVDLPPDRRNRVLAIPVQAVDAEKGSAASVMLVTPDNRVEARKIVLGLTAAGFVEVRSGLHAGDLVIIRARSTLAPGQPVQPQPTPPPANQP